jgi:hypothetical protein
MEREGKATSCRMAGEGGRRGKAVCLAVDGYGIIRRL